MERGVLENANEHGIRVREAYMARPVGIEYGGVVNPVMGRVDQQVGIFWEDIGRNGFREAAIAIAAEMATR